MPNNSNDMQYLQDALTRLEDMRDDLPVYSRLEKHQPPDWIDDMMSSMLSDVIWSLVACIVTITLLYVVFK